MKTIKKKACEYKEILKKKLKRKKFSGSAYLKAIGNPYSVKIK